MVSGVDGLEVLTLLEVKFEKDRRDVPERRRSRAAAAALRVDRRGVKETVPFEEGGVSS